jgi:hypothetical protein
MKLFVVLLAVFGLSFGAPNHQKSPRTLADDLQDFIDLLPLDDIKAIADEHLQTDGAFAAVVLYLQGPEWTELVNTVGEKPAVQDFIQYLNDAGLPVDDILAWIDNLIKGATPGTDPDEEGSLRPLLDEVEAILPLADLLALLNDKLQNSPVSILEAKIKSRASLDDTVPITTTIMVAPPRPDGKEALPTLLLLIIVPSAIHE